MCNCEGSWVCKENLNETSLELFHQKKGKLSWCIIYTDKMSIFFHVWTQLTVNILWANQFKALKQHVLQELK